MASKKVFSAMEAGDWEKVKTIVTAKRSMFSTYLTLEDLEKKHGAQKDTLLIKAARLGKEDIISLLLLAGADIEAKNEDRATALIVAAAEGHYMVVKNLFNRGADFVAIDKYGKSALQHAEMRNHYDVVQFLMALVPQLEWWDPFETASAKNFVSPLVVQELFTACKIGDWKVVKSILTANIFTRGDLEKKLEDKEDNILIKAARLGMENIVNLLLCAQADIEARNKFGATALYVAAQEGHRDTVQLLLDEGAAIEAKTSNGWTALIASAWRGHSEVVDLLCRRGANIEARENEGDSALLKAAFNGHLAVVKLLCDRDANILLPGGRNALYWAESQKHPKVVQFLKTRPQESPKHLFCAMGSGDWENIEAILTTSSKAISTAGIKKHGEQGDTLLIKAARLGEKNIVNLLLCVKADIEARNKGEATALIIAAQEGHLGIVQLLLDKGAVLESKTCHGWTALIASACMGHTEVVDFLCHSGANIEARNNDGDTALTWAAYNDRLAVVKVLCDRGANVKAKDKGGRNAMYQAEKMYHFEVVQFLKTWNQEAQQASAPPTPPPTSPGPSPASATENLSAEQSTNPMAQQSSSAAPIKMETILSPTPAVIPEADDAPSDFIYMTDLKTEQLRTILDNLNLSQLVVPFENNRVDGTLLDGAESSDDIVDIDRSIIKGIYAKKFFKLLKSWKEDGGKIQRSLLVPSLQQPLRTLTDTSPNPSSSARLVIASDKVITSSGNSWILDGTFSGGFLGYEKQPVKVKVVSADKKSTLQYELDALRKLMKAKSKYFVNPLHDNLISQEEFTVTSAGESIQQFDNHFVMVMEKGIVTLDEHLRLHSNELSIGDYLQITTCLLNMLKDAHENKIVLMDVKGSNLMLFEVSPGFYIWKAIDLDGCLDVNTLLRNSSFMATFAFMAPELILSIYRNTELLSSYAMDLWSMGILIFNVFVCNQRQTFWTLLGIHNDADINAEIVGGTLTQKRIDDHIERSFPGSTNSSQRHFLQRILRIDPSERYSASALLTASLVTGGTSLSASTIYNGQKQIVSELKLLHDLVSKELISFRTSIQSLLDEDGDGLAYNQVSLCLEELKSLLQSQAQSTVPCGAAVKNLTNWTIPTSSDTAGGQTSSQDELSAFMGTIMTQLTLLLTVADQQNADTLEQKNLLLQLSNEVHSVQEQVKKVGEDVAAMYSSFVAFGEHIRGELNSNASQHTQLLQKLQSFDQSLQLICESQTTARADAEKTVQLCEQTRQQLVLLSIDTAEIDKKIEINTRLLKTLIENTYNVPTFMVLLPVAKKGVQKLNLANLFYDEVKLVFICGFTFELVRCGPKGMGYKVKNLKSWVKKALPVLKVGLMLLQVGLFATGMPIPLAGLAHSTVLSPLDKLPYIQAAFELLQEGNAPLDSLNSELSSLESPTEKISAAIRKLHSTDDQESVRSAYETLAAFLKEADPTLEHIGMSQQITSSGKVVWINNDPKTIKLFKETNGVFSGR